MTPLARKIESLKASNSIRSVEAGKVMMYAAKEAATAVSELFEDAIADGNIQDELDLAKATAFKQPSMVCIITEYGATVRIDFDRYKDGKFKVMDDEAKAIFISVIVTVLTDKYPEYKIYKDGKVIIIEELPPPPKKFSEWFWSLFKSKEVI